VGGVVRREQAIRAFVSASWTFFGVVYRAGVLVEILETGAWLIDKRSARISQRGTEARSPIFFHHSSFVLSLTLYITRALGFTVMQYG
jgi:hypothetical protein